MSISITGLVIIVATTGFYQDGNNIKEMCVVSMNSEFKGFFEGECKNVGPLLYKEELSGGKSPMLTVNGVEYNKL